MLDRGDCAPCEAKLGIIAVDLLTLIKNAYCSPLMAPTNACFDGTLDNLITMIEAALSTEDGQKMVAETCEAMDGVCALTFEDDTCDSDISTILYNAVNQPIFTEKVEFAVELAESAANLDPEVVTAVNAAYVYFMNLLGNQADEISAETICDGFELLKLR